MAHGNSVAQKAGWKTSQETFNPVLLDFYEKVGYLPDAIVNYLLLLGWSLDDKTEHFTRQEMVRHFTLDRVNNAPASFDPEKLFAFQSHYMQNLPIDEKLELVLPYLKETGLPLPTDNQINRILEAADTRIKVAGDILEYTYLFCGDNDFPYDEKAFQKRLRKSPETAGLLKAYDETLAKQDPFDAASLEKMTTSFVEAKGIKLGAIIHAVRVAVTGQPVGFGLYETLEILGRDRCAARIQRALQQI